MTTFPRTFFTIASGLTALLCATWMAAPVPWLAIWGDSDPDAMAVYMGQRYGAMFLGYTTLLWLARETAASPSGRTIAAAGVVVSGGMALLSAWGAISGVAGPTIWVTVVVETVLAVGFAWIWRRP